jgi:hypothetical protein
MMPVWPNANTKFGRCWFDWVMLFLIVAIAT